MMIIGELGRWVINKTERKKTGYIARF